VPATHALAVTTRPPSPAHGAAAGRPRVSLDRHTAAVAVGCPRISLDRRTAAAAHLPRRCLPTRGPPTRCHWRTVCMFMDDTCVDETSCMDEMLISMDDTYVYE
jgi:hypothetical protein